MRQSYDFKLNCDRNIIEELIQSYIKLNNFKLIETNKDKYYRAGSIWISGYKYFNYIITENEIKIYAWLKGITGELSLDDKKLKMNMLAINYRETLSILFKEIEKINK